MNATATVTATAKKVTMATVKSFIKKNRAKLLIKISSRFDGMTDGLEWNKDAQFVPVVETGRVDCQYSLGLSGVWIVGGSRNWVEAINVPGYVGYSVSNCCGKWTVAVKVD